MPHLRKACYGLPSARGTNPYLALSEDGALCFPWWGQGSTNVIDDVRQHSLSIRHITTNRELNCSRGPGKILFTLHFAVIYFKKSLKSNLLRSRDVVYNWKVHSGREASVFLGGAPGFRERDRPPMRQRWRSRLLHRSSTNRY